MGPTSTRLAPRGERDNWRDILSLGEFPTKNYAPPRLKTAHQFQIRRGTGVTMNDASLDTAVGVRVDCGGDGHYQLKSRAGEGFLSLRKPFPPIL